MIRLKLQLTNITNSMAVNKESKGTGSRMAGISRNRKVAILLFLLYFGVLFYFLFFSEKMGRTFVEREYHYNLIPFLEIRRFIIHYEVLGIKAVLLNVVGNVVAFMPFGFFLPIFSGRCRYFFNTVFYTLELSLAVELLQLVTKVGSFDVDDLILNTLGGAMGFVVYHTARWLMIRKNGRGRKQ